MAGIRQILQRKKAVESICRITRTMEMISTAKYKAYHNKLDAVTEYHDALARIGYLLMTSKEPIEHPLMKSNNSGRSAILALGSMRGLCGSFNSHVYRLVDVHIKRAKQLGKKIDIYAPDRRIMNIFHHQGITPAKVYKDIEETPTQAQIEDITNGFIEQYINGHIDYLGIVYMRYFSASSQKAQTLTVLPLPELIDDLTTRATVIWPWDMSLEDFYMSPSASEVIEGLARMIVQSSIEMCFMDSSISEHLARMVAMRSATENAEGMIKDLNLEYNRARQGQITGELLDIIGGTGVL